MLFFFSIWFCTYVCARHAPKGLNTVNIENDSGIKNLFILRDEFLQSDFDAFLSEVIGWPVHYPTMHNHADYAGNNDSLPVPYHDCVKKLLHSEYVMYDLILAEFQKRQRTPRK